MSDLLHCHRYVECDTGRRFGYNGPSSIDLITSICKQEGICLRDINNPAKGCDFDEVTYDDENGLRVKDKHGQWFTIHFRSWRI